MVRRAPTITNINPTSGPYAGGSRCLDHGTNLAVRPSRLAGKSATVTGTTAQTATLHHTGARRRSGRCHGDDGGGWAIIDGLATRYVAAHQRSRHSIRRAVQRGQGLGDIKGTN